MDWIIGILVVVLLVGGYTFIQRTADLESGIGQLEDLELSVQTQQIRISALEREVKWATQQRECIKDTIGKGLPAGLFCR